MGNQKTVGILLAGGLSRRYGTPKAFATYKGKKFYEITYHTLAAVSDEVIIVTREAFLNRFPKNKKMITDKEPYVGCGPLAGIYSAMNEIKADRYVVLPCDMPLMEKDVMNKLLQAHTREVTVAISEGYMQPLVSIWDSHMKEKIKDALDHKRFKMIDVLQHSDVTKVDGYELSNSLHPFINVNTPDDDKEMRQWEKS